MVAVVPTPPSVGFPPNDSDCARCTAPTDRRSPGSTTGRCGGDPDRDRLTRCGVVGGRGAAGAIDRGDRHAGERKDDAGAGARRSGDRCSAVGGVRRCLAHAVPTRLGGGDDGCEWVAVGRAAEAGGPWGVVCRCVVAEWCVRPGGARRSTGVVARDRRAPNAPGTGERCGVRAHAGHRGSYAWADRGERGAVAGIGACGGRGPWERAAWVRHHGACDHGGGGKGGEGPVFGGVLCHRHGASLVCAFRGSRSARCGAAQSTRGAGWRRRSRCSAASWGWGWERRKRRGEQETEIPHRGRQISGSRRIGRPPNPQRFHTRPQTPVRRADR